MPDATFLTNRIFKSSEAATIHPPKGKSNQSLKVMTKKNMIESNPELL